MVQTPFVVESAMAMLAARAVVDVEFGRRRICLARGHLLVGLLRLVAVFASTAICAWGGNSDMFVMTLRNPDSRCASGHCGPRYRPGRTFSKS
jgi:hypothetical protein